MKFSTIRVLSAGLGAWLLATALPASAHFLWLDVPGGASPSVQLRFGEDPKDPTIPSLLERIQKARVWSADGSALALKAGDDALTAPLPDGTRLVGAEQEWGVVDRRDQGRGLFLLRYYAKAARDEDAAAQSARLPLEVFAKENGSVVHLTVQRDGKPVGGSELWVMRPGNSQPLQLKTGETGEALVQVSGAGEVQVRAMVADDQSGKLGDKSYDLIRSYSTLTFPVKAEESANFLLEGAHSMRETWGKEFPGFTAHVRMEQDGKASEGMVKVAADGTVDAHLDDPDFQKDASETLESVVAHRQSSEYRYKPTFAATDRHPLGRAVLLNDSMGSMYRIRDGQIMQVNRSMGEGHFTVNILQNTRLDNGRYLPQAYAVTYWDKDGKVKNVESYSERYEKVGAFWLPVERHVVTNGDGTLSISTLSLTHLQLNPATKTASTN